MNYLTKHFSHLLNNTLAVLAGRTITGVYKTQDGTCFGFDTDNGRFVFRVVSSCCSKSWIENIDVLGRLPAKILEISNTKAGRGRFIKIKTTRGYIDIDGRNNGGSTGMYSFEYELSVTDEIYRMCFGKVLMEEDWAEFNQTKWDFAPGFHPKARTGFDYGAWVKVT